MRIRPALTATLLGLILPVAAGAANGDAGLLPDCTADGNCQLNDMLQGFVNIANWGLSILGLIGVFMFVVGGLYLMLSAGRSSMVTRGKAILAGATTGILIVLFAWVGIGTVYVAVTGDPEGTIFAGVTGVTPFSFLKQTTSPGGLDETPAPTSCTPTASPGLQVGCQEPLVLVRGPIHVTNILLNSKPSCWVGGPILIRNIYDDALAAAVKNFQQANGITITGTVDPTTWDLLWQPNTTCVPSTVLDETGQPIPLARGGCCIPSDNAVGSCAEAYIDASTGTGFANGLCGDGFTYSNAACNDLATSGNYLACTAPASSGHEWGDCSYLFTAPYGPSPRTWKTGTVTCDALDGSIP